MEPAEPSGPIQLIPPGLLGLLQLKSPMGVNPLVLNNDVQPSLDMLQFYLRSVQEDTVEVSDAIVTGLGGSGAFLGGPVVLQVPANQWWYVHVMQLRTHSLAIADGLDSFQCGYATSTTGSAIFYGVQGEVQSKVVGAQAGSLRPAAYNFWMPPGAQIAYRWNAATIATSLNIFAQLRISRLRV